MKKLKRFTFKTEKATGKYCSFYSDTHHIKLNKCEVGLIGSEKPHRIKFMVIKDEVGNSNCDWKWITLKAEFNSIDDAKDFIRRNNDTIQKKFNLKQIQS